MGFPEDVLNRRMIIITYGSTIVAPPMLEWFELRTTRICMQIMSEMSRSFSLYSHARLRLPQALSFALAQKTMPSYGSVFVNRIKQVLLLFGRASEKARGPNVSQKDVEVSQSLSD